MNSSIHISSVPCGEVYTKMCLASQQGAYASYLRGKRCQTDESFFNEISASFQFPYYFGENWNALYDCLTDLEWLSFKKIVIVMDDYSEAFKSDLEGKTLLLKAFNIMIEAWKEQDIDVEIWLNN